MLRLMKISYADASNIKRKRRGIRRIVFVLKPPNLVVLDY